MQLARGKLLLFGEHSAVAGYPAIGLPLPWTLRIEGDAIESDIPIGVGFGSSAALCVAQARAEHADPICIWQKAHALERQYHAHPSGIDTGISVFEALCYFEKKEKELPDCRFLECQSLSLVIGALPRSGSTAQLVEMVRRSNQNSCLSALGEITEKAAEQIRDPNSLGRLADQAHELLSNFGLSTPHLDNILSLGRSFGSFGGKLSGAGGGGAYYMVAKSPKEAEEIAAQLKQIILNQKIPYALLPQSYCYVKPTN